LLEDLIKTIANVNDIVLDLTTGKWKYYVNKNTNRSFIGIEKDENS
jgi:DNA modification methylase